MTNVNTLAGTIQLPNDPTSPPSPPDQYVVINDIRLRYWQAGERGSPVLLLHGLNGCVENWRWNIGALAERHRVFALDGPGHGLSQPDDRSFNLNFSSDLIVEFLRRQHVERATFVALSGSGIIALNAALTRPEVVDKLVLADAAGLGRDINARMRIFSMLPLPPPRVMNRPMSRDDLRSWLSYTFFQSPTALSEPMLDDFHANIARPHTMLTASRLMRWGVNLFGQKFVFSRRLKQIAAPTLIIWGRQDRLIPLRHGIRAARTMPHARLVVFDPCGHLPMLDRSDDFNRVVLEFLQTQSNDQVDWR